MNRAEFFKRLGLGGAAIAAIPLLSSGATPALDDEIDCYNWLDTLDFAKHKAVPELLAEMAANPGQKYYKRAALVSRDAPDSWRRELVLRDLADWLTKAHPALKLEDFAFSGEDSKYTIEFYNPDGKMAGWAFYIVNRPPR